MATYLEDLAVRLAIGAAGLDDATRERHTTWLLARQQPDGGFAGREGPSDLYYTGFGLRGLSMLGVLYGEPAERAASYLRPRLQAQETIIDFLSLMYAAFLLDTSAGINIFDSAQAGWQDKVATWLEALRREDGGYAKGPEGHASSTYHSFLVSLCLELLERQVPEPAKMVAFLQRQRADEGGFREIRAGKRAGTNPTAAAIGTLRLLDALDADITEETADFLAEMQTDEGGLRANTRIPIADILSSFTGWLTLVDLQTTDAIDPRWLLRFARQMEHPEGGFLAAAWDEVRDVEYTFYGVGLLALLPTADANQSPAE